MSENRNPQVAATTWNSTTGEPSVTHFQTLLASVETQKHERVGVFVAAVKIPHPQIEDSLARPFLRDPDGCVSRREGGDNARFFTKFLELYDRFQPVLRLGTRPQQWTRPARFDLD